MTLHLHHLTGCAPEPLAHYLKALGVLRVVAEQKDRDARGWWQDEHFCLLTHLDRVELQRFFIEDYAPTPVFNPWGGRSGFYAGASEKTAREALEKVEASSEKRLEAFRSAIAAARAAIELGGGDKPEENDDKSALITALNKTVRGSARDWLGTVMVLVGDDYRPPALLGTGGNEGSASYTSVFLSAVVSCIVHRAQDRALGLFQGAELEVHATADYAWEGAFGQFLPSGQASGWDLLLLVEGAVLFRSSVGVRSSEPSGGAARFLASPFYFATRAAGAVSIAPADEFSLNKGRKNPGRGEQWFPLWRSPSTLWELQTVISEGRCSVDRKRAGHAFNAARAVGRLGVALGIDAFVRYGYLQRNNLASHFAVPLGRVDVRQRPASHLLDDLAPWLDRLHRAARDKSAPASLIDGERRLADAAFAVLLHDDSPGRWQSVLCAAVSIEELQACGVAIGAGPVPPLSPEWVSVSNDGSPEWRLARGLGSAAAAYSPRLVAVDPVRQHWLPLKPGGHRFQEQDRRLAHDPRVVCSGRDAISDFSAVVERRLIEAAQGGSRALPLVAVPGCEAEPTDLTAMLAGDLDLEKISSLGRAFMALRWQRWQRPYPLSHPARSLHEWPDEAWLAVRLACLPWPLDRERTIPVDETIVRRLRVGDGASAVDMALRRLRSAGVRPSIEGACVDPLTARLWAAALAFPISRATARRMARQFEGKRMKETR